MDNQKLGPCMLEGNFVRLEPLREKHSEALTGVAKEQDWAWFLGPLRTRADVDRRIAEGMNAEGRDEAYAFAVVLKESSQVVGSTSFMTIVAKHKRAEIGSTWYSPSVWGTAVNPECKYLLLKHAFEDWGAVRIQLGTDENNLHSQHAILKLGAKFEGRLRNHGIRVDGTVRDALLYSITSDDWPEVRTGLLRRLQGFRSTSNLP